MDVVTHIRIWAHLLWIAWATTLFFMAYVSRGKSIRITHVKIGMAALVLFVAWFSGLLITVRGVELLPRGSVIPTLAALEFGSATLAWGWLILCGNRNYRIELRRNDRTTLLVVVWLTVLFLG